MPISTILIVFGSWLLILTLVLIYFFRNRSHRSS